MSELRTILAQGRKRIGFLIGAGAPAGIRDPASGQPLIPAIAELTSQVLKSVPPKFDEVISGKRLPGADYEWIERTNAKDRLYAAELLRWHTYGNERCQADFKYVIEHVKRP